MYILCKKAAFAEPHDFVDKNAPRIKKLDEYINKLGLTTSSIEARKQINATHVDILNNIIFVDNLFVFFQMNPHIL